VLIADTEHARLLHGTMTTHDRLHLDEVAKLATTFQAGEHHRTTRTGQAGRSGNLGHEHEEKIAHFARELAAWIEQAITTRSIATCTVFAPTHFLGALRQQVTKPVAAKLKEHAGELAQMTVADLTRHPRIVELMAP
jgi:protein required for attachment to host cells